MNAGCASIVVTLICLSVSISAQRETQAQTSSSSTERCLYKEWQKRSIRDIEGPCHFFHMSTPGPSFMQEGLVLNATISLNFDEHWSRVQLHFASCVRIKTGDGAVCGITHIDGFGQLVLPNSSWYRWGLQLRQLSDGKFVFGGPDDPKGKWVNLWERSTTKTYDGRPYVMPAWSKAHIDAIKGGTPLPPTVRALGVAPR